MKWLDISDDRKRVVLEEAAARLQASKNAIEKDWWVTIVLKAVYNTTFAKDIIFKGGTSLSKSWHLIKRFSEDVDIAINRSVLGFNEKLTISEIKRLKRAGAEFTSTVFKDALAKELYALGIPEDMIVITATPIKPDFPDTDPQEIFVEYKSAVDPDVYLPPRVKVEMSVRSLTEPAHERDISSLIDEAVPGQDYAGKPFIVLAIDPRITILEKIFLLHEEFTKPYERIIIDRMSRHLHDLEQTMDTQHSLNAITDHDLYQQIVEHRKHVIRHRHVNYDRHGQSTIQFLPQIEWLGDFKADYEKMKLSMFSGEAPSFEEVIAKLNVLQERIRNSNKMFL